MLTDVLFNSTVRSDVALGKRGKQRLFLREFFFRRLFLISFSFSVANTCMPFHELYSYPVFCPQNVDSSVSKWKDLL